MIDRRSLGLGVLMLLASGCRSRPGDAPPPPAASPPPPTPPASAPVLAPAPGVVPGPPAADAARAWSEASRGLSVENAGPLARGARWALPPGGCVLRYDIRYENRTLDENGAPRSGAFGFLSFTFRRDPAADAARFQVDRFQTGALDRQRRLDPQLTSIAALPDEEKKKLSGSVATDGLSWRELSTASWWRASSPALAESFPPLPAAATTGSRAPLAQGSTKSPGEIRLRRWIEVNGTRAAELELSSTWSSAAARSGGKPIDVAQQISGVVVVLETGWPLYGWSRTKGTVSAGEQQRTDWLSELRLVETCQGPRLSPP